MPWVRPIQFFSCPFLLEQKLWNDEYYSKFVILQSTSPTLVCNCVFLQCVYVCVCVCVCSVCVCVCVCVRVCVHVCVSVVSVHVCVCSV